MTHFDLWVIGIGAGALLLGLVLLYQDIKKR